MKNLIPGMEFLYQLKPGESYILTEAGPIVVHPDSPPRLLKLVDGQCVETEISAASQTEMNCDGQG